MPNITTDKLEECRNFYTDLLGFRVAMDMGWIVTLVSPSNPTAQISLVHGAPSDAADQHMTLSIEE